MTKLWKTGNTLATSPCRVFREPLRDAYTDVIYSQWYHADQTT